MTQIETKSYEDVEIGSPEWNGLLDDADTLHEWVDQKISQENEIGPWSLSAAAQSLSWNKRRVREAVEMHYWMFMQGDDAFDVDGE